jgi:hypothetical protein
MSAGVILTVLSNIPWAQVVENAPKVADAAGRLWDSVTRRNAETTEKLEAEPQRPASQAELLKRRVDTLEEALEILRGEMQASSQLIKQLAEQNTVLVGRIELNRLKLIRLIAGTGIGFSIVLALCSLLFIRS